MDYVSSRFDAGDRLLLSESRRRVVSPLVIASLAACVGCSGGSDSSRASSSSSGSSNSTSTSGTQGQIIGAAGSGSSSGSVVSGSSSQCIQARIASFGRLAHYGNGNDDTAAFQDWLNTKSTAQMDLIQTHETLTSDLLSQYDILILQALEDSEQGPFWQFTDDEKSALSSWVNGGGGLITLIGYGGNAQEVTGTNQLLSFSSISYNQDDIFASCSNNLCYCWGNTIPITDWKTSDPISTEISFSVTEIGAYHGRSINAGDAVVVATDGSGHTAAAAKDVGSGHVFVFADEWVTYSSQWLGTGQQQTINTYDPCYDSSGGYMRTADKEFQIPQFWYNVLKWMVPSSKCTFEIDNPTIVVPK